MLSDMGRLGYVKIYLRLGVGGDSLGHVRRRKETPAGGRGGGRLPFVRSFRSVPPPAVRRSSSSPSATSERPERWNVGLLPVSPL